MKKTIIMVVLMVMCSVPALAETLYVTDNFEINIRSGPGSEYRILRMIRSGQTLELIETGDTWSHVRLPDGLEGWAFNRYLQTSPPAARTLQALTARLRPLEIEHTRLQEEKDRLLEENRALAGQLEEAEAQLRETASSYEQLRKDASEFLQIKEEHDSLTARLEEKNARIEALEGRLTDQFLSSAVKWFLAGGGVLLLGFLLGNRSKKKRSGLR